MTPEQFTILLAVIATIGTAISGYYALISGRLSKGTISYTFFVRYSDEKMKEANTIIGRYFADAKIDPHENLTTEQKEERNSKKDQLMNKWKALKEDEKNTGIKNDELEKLERSRYIIKFYYTILR